MMTTTDRMLAEIFTTMQQELAGQEGELKSLTMTNLGNKTMVRHLDSEAYVPEYGPTRVALTAKVIIRKSFTLER